MTLTLIKSVSLSILTFAIVSCEPSTKSPDTNGTSAQETAPDEAGEASKRTVIAFMDAMGKGDMDGMKALMADDMVWQNAGDSTLPWIGPWKGKDKVLSFLGTFSKNVKTTLWESEDVLASGDTVVMFGRMKLETTKSGAETDEFYYALRVKVRDGKVILWNWFEDSFAVSQAYHTGE